MLDLDSKAITEASNITLAGMLKILKSLNKNQPKRQVMNAKQSKLTNLSEPDRLVNSIEIEKQLKTF
ncbi:MAG: hypothetical protein GY820_40170 [Gammaproteobacteria bacterium]|nr:hypothetical protein [Gammaproteobacteria bacterium]